MSGGEKVQHDEFIGKVQAAARLPSRGDAEKAARATLETLGERLAGGEPGNLAAQLPQEIGRYLEEREGTAERFGLDDFFNRVSERSGADLPGATHQARAVVAVLGEAVSEGELDDVRQQLPEEFTPLFESGSEGAMRTD
jgi:uncharacterized protein (DUF2267 family)